jgi:type IV pilus assembly protein PilV
LRKAARQRGVMLIETMIAILIFSLGVLSVVKLQAASVQQSTDAEYRSMAALLANDLVGRMWSSDRTPTKLEDNFKKDGPGYKQWVDSFKAAGLPNANEVNLNTVPSVAFNATTNGTEVTIVVKWVAPGEKEMKEDKKSHGYTTVVLMK